MARHHTVNLMRLRSGVEMTQALCTDIALSAY